VINIRPGSDVARVTFEPSGLVTMYVRTGSPVRFNADTIVSVKRDPAGTCIVTEGRVWFNIGPLWQREQLTTPGVGMKNLRPRRSDSVCPSGRAGGGPPPAEDLQRRGRVKPLSLKIGYLLKLQHGRLLDDLGMREERAERLVGQIGLAAVPHDERIERNIVRRKRTAKQRHTPGSRIVGELNVRG